MVHIRLTQAISVAKLVVLLAFLPISLAAQQGGTVSGMVVSAESHRPLEGAQIVLHPSPLGLLGKAGGTGPLLLGEGLSTTTASDGGYVFADLPAGRYRMYVYALGYRPATLDLRLAGRETSRLSVGLRVETVVLERIVITAPQGDAFGSPTLSASADDVAMAAERIRKNSLLATDARVITRQDVQQAVTLGEIDPLRALQRLPGVTSRDDYTTELWTRGAPWDQTAVYFDGVPLFNAMHAAGAVSAFNADAIGAVFFHPGVQPAELASGGAGLIDLRTRRAGLGPFSGSSEISLLSMRVGADGSALDGRVGWMVSARRSHLDLLTFGIRALGGDSSFVAPYVFSDLTGRVDLRLGNARLDVSGIHERDHLDGAVPGIVLGSTARWGSSAGQATFAFPFHGGELRHTLGVSHLLARAGDLSVPPERLVFGRAEDPVTGPFRLQPLDSRVAYVSLGGSWDGADTGPLQLSGGYRLVSQSTRFHTRGFWPYRTDADGAFEDGGRLRYGMLWGEVEGELGSRVKVEAGGRVEVGPSILDAGRVRLAPRIVARYQAGPETRISAAAGRTWQYAQALDPAGPGHERVAISGVFWTLAGDSVPAIRSDLVTFGVERHVGEGLVAAVNTYRRIADGVLVPDPREGWLANRPLAVSATNRAYGADVSLRKIAGRWTGSAAYSYGISGLEAMGERFRAPTSREHSLDLGAMLKVVGEFRVGAAFTEASGIRYTRYEWMMEDCDATGETGCRLAAYARPPGAMEAPRYRSLDLMTDWGGSVGRWRVSSYAQLRNVLGRENVGAYTASHAICMKPQGESCNPILQPDPTSWDPRTNRFLAGLPFIPLAGVRVTF